MKKTTILVSAAAGVMLAAGVASAQTTVNVGVINTFSGPTAAQGDMLERGLQLYYKTHEKDLPPGVKINLIERDDTGAFPDIAKRLASELVTRDHAQIITGFVWSPNFMAVAPVATEAKVPMVSMNAAALAAPSKSPYLTRTSFTLTQQAYPLGLWAVKHGYKKAYTAVSDYAPGHEGADAFAAGFKEAGGSVMGALTFPAPPTTPDFAPFLQKVKDAKPDVLYIFVPAGPQATAIMKAAKDLDLAGAGIHLISTEDLVPDEQLPNIGDQAIGLMTSGVYSPAATRPTSKAFVDAWYKAGNKIAPDFESADAWDGMRMIFDFVIKTKGKFTGDEAMAYFSHWKSTTSPKGTVLIDPETRQIVQDVWMREVKKQGDMLANVEVENLGLLDAMGKPYKAAK